MEILRLLVSMASFSAFMLVILLPTDGNAKPEPSRHLPGSSPPVPFICTCQSTSATFCRNIGWSLNGEQLTEEHSHVSRITFNNRSLTSHLWLTDLTSEMDNAILVCEEGTSGVEIKAWKLYIESKDSSTQ